MASIDRLIAENFGDDASFSLPDTMTNLDLGIMRAGKMAELIRNEVLHPAMDDAPDEEAIAALCTSLIAYLGFLGASVDEVERRVSAGRIVITPVGGV